MTVETGSQLKMRAGQTMRTGEGVLSDLDSVQKEVVQGKFSQWRRNPGFVHRRLSEVVQKSRLVHGSRELSINLCMVILPGVKQE